MVIQSSKNLANWNENWKELILKCTRINPEERPSSSEVLKILTELVNNTTNFSFF